MPLPLPLRIVRASTGGCHVVERHLVHAIPVHGHRVHAGLHGDDVPHDARDAPPPRQLCARNPARTLRARRDHAERIRATPRAVGVNPTLAAMAALMATPLM